MQIDYDYSKNAHGLPGPGAALKLLCHDLKPRSLLDVGCGMGTWLKAAQEAGVTDVFGVDGIELPPDRFHVSKSLFSLQDLTKPWNLGRRFDTALCLEVAEHLDRQFAAVLVGSLTTHSDCIVFSAACPGQGGQHHVNCQWPAYWQELFNERGYACSDAIRWKIWNDDRIEPWYRQNMFLARRDPVQAGKEPRIEAVIHPDHFGFMTDDFFRNKLKDIENGWLPFTWYLSSTAGALRQKLSKKLRGH
jgi:SAM-dependent methyltransferase